MCWNRPFSLNLNVRVAVNVSTKMSIAHIRIKAARPTSAAAKSPARAAKATAERQSLLTPSPSTKQRSNKPPGGVPTILIINLLFLMLLSHCDVCKSNEFPMTASAEAGAKAAADASNDAAAAANANSTASSRVASADNIMETTEIVTRDCLKRCTDEEKTFLDDFGIKCETGDPGEKCFRSRCTKGCEQWWRALKDFEPCPEACSAAQFYPANLPCISACEMAQGQYWHMQGKALAPLVEMSPPVLLNENSSDTLTLRWAVNFPDDYLASRPFNIQYQYAVSNDTLHWSNLADYNCNENYDCEILDGLMPFTSYRFRFELPFGDGSNDVLYSQPTDVFKTAPKGVPISEPNILHLFALDHAHVAISWQPGQFTNGPLTGYKLTVNGTNSTTEQILPKSPLHHIVNGLLPSTNYTLQIAMLNEEGEGPFAELSVYTKDLIKNFKFDLNEELNTILIVGEYSIKKKSLDSLAETELIYHSEQLISDFALNLADQRLFVVEDNGNIYSLHLDNPTMKTPIALEKSTMNFKPKKLSVDWLNQKIFISVEITSKTWALISTDFDGKNVQLLADNLSEAVKQLQVDPINGWIFWSHSTGLTRMNLANNLIKPVLVYDNLGYFSNDFNRCLLIAYNKTSNELFELSYDGLYKERVSLNSTLVLQGDLQGFVQFGDGVVGTNGSHLMHQSYHNSENGIWEIKDLEWCWHVLPLQHNNRLQPIPVPIERPTKVQALLTSSMAKISWTAPARNDFQSDHAWWQWEYELEIMDVASNSAFNIRNIKTTYFNVEKLQANNLYKLRVRAASRSGVGEWSEELLTRTWPLGEHKLMWGGAGGIFETNEVGAQITRIGEIENVQDFAQLNGTIYYISVDRRLQCVNMMNPEVNCSFAASNAVSLSYDWRGGKLYWVDKLRNCLLRANLDGSEREMLNIFDAQYIQIDSNNGHIYYATASRLARRALNGVFETEENEYFHVNGFGGMIRAFALNTLQKQLYWIVRQNEGHVRLFKTSSENKQQKFEVKLLDHDVEFGSLRYLADIESLLWLQFNKSRGILARTDNLEAQTPLEAAELSNIKSLHIRSDYTLYMDLSVVPEAVDVDSIRIEDGYWDDFNIKWNSVTTAENYTVFYRVVLQYGDERKPRLYSMEVNEPFIRITEFHQPHLLLNVSITPHTYWRAGSSVSVQLRTPAAAPTQPKRLRIFVQHADAPLQTMPNISAIIRWDPPENVSINAEISYKVYCWSGEELYAEHLLNFSSDRPLEATVADLSVGETYSFQVQAFAHGRASGGEKTAFHTLHVNPEVQAVPRILFTTSEYIGELDLDFESHKTLVHTTSEVEHLAVVRGEQRLLWVNENVELLSFVPGSTPVKLARMRAEVLSLTVDWVARIIYWAEMAKGVESAVSIFKLDLCQFEARVMLGTKIFTTKKGRLLKELLVLPFSRSLVWLEYDFGHTNATMVGRNLSDMSELHFESAPLIKLFAGSFFPEMETVNLVDHRGKMCAYDISRHICNPLKTHFNVLTDEVRDIGRDTGYIYTLNGNTVRAYNRRKQNLEYSLDFADVKKIHAYNYQLYPKRKCLLPEAEKLMKHPDMLNPLVEKTDESFLTLTLPDLNTIEECWLEVPGARYTIIISGDEGFLRNITAFERSVNITQLQPFTNYTLQLIASSYYQHKLGLAALESEAVVVRTTEGTPSTPQNFTALAISPTEIHVSWDAPLNLNCDKVWYQLHWQMENSSVGAHKKVEQTSVILTNLEPSQEYTIWLKAFSTEAKFATTEHLTVLTLAMPNSLLLVGKTPYNFTLSWVPSSHLTKIVLICHELNGENEFSLDVTENSTLIVVQDLEPKTKYEFYLELSYLGIERPYYWPEVFNERFIFETLGDVPSSPGRPQIEHITNEIFKVFWEPARNNGAPVIEYSLEALQARNHKRKRRAAENAPTERTIMLRELPWAEEPQPLEDKWIVYCNGSELSCIVRDLHTLRLLMFRVRARNDPYGWGPYSEDSERVWEPFVSSDKRSSLVYAIITPAAIVSCCVVILVILRMIQTRRTKARKLLEKSRPSIWSNVSTLQQQQLMAARNRAFSLSSHSTLYTGGPLSDADIALLPHISWNQITLLNFLGSGAFGEVYEGLMKYDDDEEQEKVAIKSLRKGASEFAELLQEAQLMSNFKHENIVRLIGVCCDAESISIIMEHMEGGDLLSYLRESRPNANKPLASLQLIDLMTMCIDVATGCSYLEDMHFVHRDLACRNCLVSSRVPSKRVVKIGDFGLARDIYKNDYYRKEGEGLLPVRWMSPESLVDGVFTTQSDVWAFAVLCWEILTLGQQPYAARNNFEVLNFVKEGGRLKQPENCPAKLFTLLLECWNTDPEQRPSFRKCLNVLLATKTDVRRVSLGYNTDDGDYAMYANHNGILLSSFLANPSNLSKVEEDVLAENDDDCSTSVASTSRKSDLKDIEIETVSDDSHLIEDEVQREGKNVNFFINEGISRL